MNHRSASSFNPPALGVGLTYSAAIEPLVAAEPGLVDLLEVEPQTAWTRSGEAAAPYRRNPEIEARIAAHPARKLIHSIGTPVGGTVRPEPAQLELLAETIRRFDSPWVSDHLSFNQTPEHATGFFLPPRQTLAGVEAAAAAIADLQSALPVPVAVETGVNYLRPRSDELGDGEFVARVVEAADCGLLLDMHNLFTNSLNGRLPLAEVLDALPLDRVWEVHLAGGLELDGFWLDAHSGAIPDPLYAVCESLIGRLPKLGAIVFEIFPSFVAEVGLELVAAQLERVRRLWDLRSRPQEAPSRAEPTPTGPITIGRAPNLEPIATPANWERALGGLVTGRSPADPLGKELAADPGVRIVEGLIHEFRASMIVGVLRLSSRLIMLALGTDAFRTILNDYFAKVQPQMYGGLEAEKFADYLEQASIPLPYLAKLVEFELAIAATLLDDEARIVEFEFEPLPLLRALAAGRLPETPAERGRFEIELTADGPEAVTGLSRDDLREAFPFH